MSRPTTIAAPPALPIRLLAVTAGLTVANLYYNQPLLPEIGRTFGVSDGRAGLVSTATQIGYAVGLLLFVPLADVLERRRLMVTLLVGVAVSLAAAAAAPGLGWLAVASFAIGVTTVVPQVVVPYGAGLVEPEERGRVVGQIMSGLLIGILAARVISGALGAVVGWRAVFAIMAVAMLVLAAVLARRLPPGEPAEKMSYGALLRSLVEIARTEPALRDASILGALLFFAFSAFWTTLAFRLEAPPLHYGSTVAGLFGIIGIVGASIAPVAGRIADRWRPRDLVGAATVVMVVAFAIFLVAGSTIAGLVVGVILLDAGEQAAQVSNQTRVYRLPAPLHGRLNTVFMVSFFIGGSVGSAAASWAWGVWRWTGVCAVSLAALIAALAVYTVRRRREMA